MFVFVKYPYIITHKSKNEHDEMGLFFYSKNVMVCR